MKQFITSLIFISAIFLIPYKAAAESSVDVKDTVTIPAGEFTMVLEYNGEKVERQIYLDEYEIDKFETSIHEYGKCVLRGNCGVGPLIKTIIYLYKDELIPEGSEFEAKYEQFMEKPYLLNKPFWKIFYKYPEYMEIVILISPKVVNGKKPIGYLDYSNAWQYCKFVGGRLPTNAEWERAARGNKDARIYSWGNDAPTDCTYGNLSGMFTPMPANCPNAPIDARSEEYPPSPAGVYNMVGNQREYIIDTYEPTYYDFMEDKNPIGIIRFFSEENQKKIIKESHSKIKNVKRLTKGNGFMKLDKNTDNYLFPLPKYTPASISSLEIAKGKGFDNGVRCVYSEKVIINN